MLSISSSRGSKPPEVGNRKLESTFFIPSSSALVVMTQSPDQDPQRNQQPIVVQQSGNGTAVGLVIAAVILAGGAIWAVTIWSNTQQKMIDAPAEAIKEGTKAIKEGANAIKEGVEGAAESIKPGS
jgi:uncharacterized protein HemX